MPSLSQKPAHGDDPHVFLGDLFRSMAEDHEIGALAGGEDSGGVVEAGVGAAGGVAAEGGQWDRGVRRRRRGGRLRPGGLRRSASR